MIPLKPKRSILCADDNKLLLETIKMGLTFHGFNVVTAEDGADAFAKFKSFDGDFDFILTDLDMPRMDGLTLISKIRQNGYEGKIIVMSGKLDASRLKVCCEHEVSGYFNKPFQLSALTAILGEFPAESGKTVEIKSR